MKFKILSHAGISISENNYTIVIDPWILGSCYWRSWWNYPEIEKNDLNNLNADAIYLTHLHWDHFHGPSLVKYFDKKTRIFIPKVLTKRMVEDLNYLGFSNITEIAHGNCFELNSGFKIYSYQFGPGVDSALMISTKDCNLFNANDCKTFGLSLEYIKNRHGKIDFTFRSHSSASAIPYCINSYEKDFSDLRKQEDYCEEFSAFAQKLETKYAVPFASNHCFLHRDTKKYNNLATNPKMVYSVFNKMKKDTNSNSEIVIMPPGSTWDSETNEFKIKDFNYDDKEYINKLSISYDKKLREQYKLEKNTIACFESFEKYFKDFISSLPYIYRRKFSHPIIFETNNSNTKRFWSINFKENIIKVINEIDEQSIKINIPSLVLNDCTQKKMFSVWTASKRLEVFLPNKESLHQLELFFSTLDLYELDRFPIKQNFNFRGLENFILRWREILTGIGFLIKYKILNKELEIKNLYK